jgi:hypothetical protein
MIAVLLTAMLTQGPAQDGRDPLREARAAQAEFERTRRAHLPVTPHPGGRCEERVGRYCYWYDEQEPPPPPEPARIADARRVLLGHLATLAAVAPDQGWIAGQRVRYLVEAGDPDGALAVVEGCGAEAWWCSALAGFALHAAARYEAADRAFTRALRAMPAQVRCEWNDVGPLLEDGLAREFEHLDCAGRDSAAARLFWLAAPRAGRPGNDFRTEYFARRTFVTALEGAVTHHGSRFSGDLREVILRYGWATGWSRRLPAPMSAEEPGVIGHEPRPAYAFLPVADGDGGYRWAPERSRSRARYAPAWTAEIVPLPTVLLSWFDRGDSALLVAGIQVPAGLAGAEGRVSAAFSTGPADAVAWTGGAPGGRAALALAVPARPGVLALEIADTDTATRTAWERRWIPLQPAAGTPRLSDLLLFPPVEALPGSVHDAVPHALSSARAPPDGRIGLYWELYDGPGAGSEVEWVVQVHERGAGLVTRLGRALGLGRSPPPIRLAWRSVAEAPLVGQAIELDLALLRRGRYQVVVEARWAAGTRARAEREIEVWKQR